jgi:hypothetical protein
MTATVTWVVTSRRESETVCDHVDAYDRQLTDFRDRLDYIEAATGVAVAVRTKVVALGLFDNASLLFIGHLAARAFRPAVFASDRAPLARSAWAVIRSDTPGLSRR